MRSAVFVGCVRWLVRVLTYVGSNISKAVGDRGSMDHQWEMAHSESSGHVIDEVT